MADEEPKKLVRTSDAGWMQELASAYKSREPLLLVDDAHVGIDPRVDTLLRMGLQAKLSRREWSGVLISLGVATLGAGLLVAAVLDPEPYSKIGLALVTGAVLLGSGGFYAVRILTHVKPPSIRATAKGFEIFWG